MGQTPSYAATQVTSELVPARLRCEYRIDPLGIDSPRPRLDWILNCRNPAERGLCQTAYQIVVASSPQILAKDDGDLWNSGRVSSNQMCQLAYGGKPLGSNEACWWKVRVWDQSGTVSNWSPVAQWTTGVLNEADWDGAKWIGAPDKGPRPNLDGPKAKYETVLLRHEFTVKPGLRRAIVNVCGLGQYEMTMNGTKVSDDLLTPGWTQYEKTCLYDTYDVTAKLRTGINAVGLFLGNGMYISHRGRYAGNASKGYAYGSVQGIAELRLEYADGTIEHVVTDDRWLCFSGPITFSSGYGGEDYDARLEPAGWTQLGFDDAAWDRAQPLNGPGGSLKGLSCAGPPIRAFQSLVPIGKSDMRRGLTVYDLGQNASIMLRMKVTGRAGSLVRVIPGELLKAHGTVDGSIFLKKPVWWQYTLKGSGHENYFSKFFYVGARYLQVEVMPSPGSADLPTVESIEGVVVHADSPSVGQFSCSNDLFNRIFALVRWAQQNNMVSIMTDCPTREKRGWLEQDHLNGLALRYNWDMSPLFTKITNDMIDAQRSDGLVPTTCPDYVPEWLGKNGKFADSPEWSSACILIPWQQYEFYGDINLLGRSYVMMKRYQAYLANKAKDEIVSYGLGDWVDVGPKPPGESQLTPLALTATAFYFEDTFVLAQVATVLGKADDASQYAKQAVVIRHAFNKLLFNPQTNQYGQGNRVGSQCANSLPLVMDIAEAPARAAIVDNIVTDVQGKGLTTGDIGYRYLLRALADGGRSDVIYALNNQSAKPGYGYQLKLGRTSLAETWDGKASQDHFMLGQINEWFYHDLAGIQDDQAGTGFKKIVIKPAIVGDLDEVNASYDSISGRISSHWKRNGKNLILQVTVPPNTIATVFVPTANVPSVQEGGRDALQALGVRHLTGVSGCAVYQVGSGEYTFTSFLK
jgi:alpha-L-rhamnosidase